MTLSTGLLVSALLRFELHFFSSSDLSNRPIAIRMKTIYGNFGNVGMWVPLLQNLKKKKSHGPFGVPGFNLRTTDIKHTLWAGHNHIFHEILWTYYLSTLRERLKIKMTTTGRFPVHSPQYDTITLKLLSVVKRTFLNDYIILFGWAHFSHSSISLDSHWLSRGLFTLCLMWSKQTFKKLWQAASIS